MAQSRFLRLLTSTDAHSTPVAAPPSRESQSEDAKASSSAASDPSADETAKSSHRVAIKGADKRSKFLVSPVNKKKSPDDGDGDDADADDAAVAAAPADNTKDSESTVVATTTTSNTTVTAKAAVNPPAAGGGSKQPSRLMKFAQSFLPPFFYTSPPKPPQPPETAPIEAVKAHDTPGVDQKPPNSEAKDTINPGPKNTDEHSVSRTDHKKEGSNVSWRSRIDVQSTVHAHVQQVS